jgi:peroxiredoxin
MAELESFSLHIGDPAPDFALPGTDGKTYRRDDFAQSKHLLVVFWCNHCPYVQGWEGRMIDIGREYARQGVATVLINANDIKAFPDDRPERMAERAKSKGYPFPYLFDESQKVAHAYGALVTPHPMLFGPDRKLVYQGRIDDNHEDAGAAKHAYLREALDAAIAGKKVQPAERAVAGCSVKWKS